MRTLAFLTLAGLTGLTLAGRAAADDKDALQGKWKITKVTLPPDLAEGQKFIDELVKEIDIEVKGDTIIATMPKEKEPGKATFKLAADKTPKQIDITEANDKAKEPEKVQGIYKLEGDTVVVAVAAGKGIARPTEFKPSGKKEDKGGVLVITLKKAK